jgi:hypothetical protein
MPSGRAYAALDIDRAAAAMAFHVFFPIALCQRAQQLVGRLRGTVLRYGMSRETLIRHLAQAEARIALGRRHIARQYEIIAELEKVGHEAVTAKALLVIFEATHALHIADRDQIAAEIAALD